MVVEMAPSAVPTDTAFFLMRGHCFRVIKSAWYLSAHCDEPVVWKGTWRDVNGETWTVESCARHRPDRSAAT
jgi:hypothetical protein